MRANEQPSGKEAQLARIKLLNDVYHKKLITFYAIGQGAKPDLSNSLLEAIVKMIKTQAHAPFTPVPRTSMLPSIAPPTPPVRAAARLCEASPGRCLQAPRPRPRPYQTGLRRRPAAGGVRIGRWREEDIWGGFQR